jgi:hypothetical protein
MTRFAISMLVVIAACGRKDDRAAPAPVEVAKPSASDAAALKPNEPIDIHGITVKLLDDGTVEVAGTDRWGNRLDTKYENVEYFRGALPVLERSVTEEQAAGLRTVAR